MPNYERRPEPVQFQAPLDPRDSMRYTQVPADFDLQLFAAEPDVVKPIYMAWDERGRAWVVEARDYPHGLVPEGEPGLANIKICEDTNGDGKADTFTVFADKLNLATALVFVNGGIIVSEARHMLYLKDTDGDDKADVRQALLPGWGTGDTHAMQSNLARGLDNWLYGAVGYSSFRGSVGGKDLQFGQGIFRFKADGSALEFLHRFNNNTWGFGLNAYGDVFGSTANGNPTPNLRSAGIEAATGQGGAYMTENNLRDQSHGRIYRVVWKDGPKSSIKSLAKATPSELVQALDSGNQFWSLTAQRLIVDDKKTDATSALKKRVTSGVGGIGAIHALWSLEGIGALDKDTHQKALLDKDPNLRRNAIRALPSNEAGRRLFFSSPVIQDPDLLTREVAFVKLVEFPTIPEIQTVVAQLPRTAANTNDAFLNDALTLLGRIHKVSGVGEDEVKVAAGDPKRGEELFFTSPTAACASCHTVGGKGGAIGPILDGIAVRSNKDTIAESLMDPNTKLARVSVSALDRVLNG